MAYWQHIPEDFNNRLVEIADLFAVSRGAFFETADRFHWIPSQESPAARAAAELPSPDPAISAPRGETGHRLIAEVVQTYLLTASGHLGGLASLYRSGEVIFPTPVLIRSTIENCAHAVWVLGEATEDSSENRLARAYLEEIVSAEEAKKNAGRMSDKAHPSYLSANTYYKALKAEVSDRFPSTTPASLGGAARTLNGQSLPNLEAAVKGMYELTKSYGGTIDGRTGTGIYGYLSNMTHPTLYPARQRREWVTDPETGRRVTNLRVDLVSTEKEARSALAAFYNALTYTTSYFGWPTIVVDGLTEKIESSMPTFFV
ncbi:hypothetical protein [Dietzia alimentaria]|uniref:hypothetical protein n=1 Tax=Dietzia alimentaria TaxID=665550 RepID=UPI00029AE49B|nr:hypothetical protein [Dietzia alimentaria]